jgi:hypothetical protein
MKIFARPILPFYLSSARSGACDRQRLFLRKTEERATRKRVARIKIS